MVDGIAPPPPTPVTMMIEGEILGRSNSMISGIFSCCGIILCVLYFVIFDHIEHVVDLLFEASEKAAPLFGLACNGFFLSFFIDKLLFAVGRGLAFAVQRVDRAALRILGRSRVGIAAELRLRLLAGPDASGDGCPGPFCPS